MKYHCLDKSQPLDNCQYINLHNPKMSQACTTEPSFRPPQAANCCCNTYVGATDSTLLSTSTVVDLNVCLLLIKLKTLS